jgi:hypothetical protein
LSAAFTLLGLCVNLLSATTTISLDSSADLLRTLTPSVRFLGGHCWDGIPIGLYHALFSQRHCRLDDLGRLNLLGNIPGVPFFILTPSHLARGRRCILLRALLHYSPVVSCGAYATSCSVLAVVPVPTCCSYYPRS